MSMIDYPRQFFADINGLPLDSGSLYVGVENQDPQTNPIQVYWDAALTIPASQPITISAGYAMNGGARAAFYVGATAYSLRIRNKSGTQVDYIASNLGASAYRSTLPGTPALVTLQQLGSRKADVRDWQGMDLTGNNDCASLIQNGLTQATNAGVALEIPAGAIVLGSTVSIPAGAVMQGVSGLYMAGSVTGRTMFNLAHSGKGFTMTGATGGRTIRSISTRRSQPAPGVGWAPSASDWDFYIDGATDVFMDDVLLLTATKGIIATNGGGRHTFRRIWGHPLSVGIQIDTSYDVTRLEGVHFWNFWSTSSYVTDYTVNNATAIYSLRNDNADFYDIFGIFYRHNLRIGQWSGGGAGTTQRLRVFGLGADACGSGLTIDAAANGSTVELYGFYAHGHDTTITSGHLIDVQGTNGTTRIYGRTDLSNAHRSAINHVGAGAVLAVQDPVVATYNMANGGFAAVNCGSSTAGVTLRGDVGISGGVSGAAQYSGTGRILGPYLNYTPTITSGTGSFTGSATINQAIYRVIDGYCEGYVNFTLPTNNTAATDVRFTVPIAIPAGSLEPSLGRQITANRALVGQPIGGGSTIALVNFDGTYPGATGANLTCAFKYRI